MYFLVTARGTGPGSEADDVVLASTLRELRDERVVAGVWRHRDAATWVLLLEAADDDEVARIMTRFPATVAGSLVFTADPVVPL
ncbi:hypothetical protein ACXR2U_07235 [Jatrophihabitans sp. YIM 134969]